MVIRTFLIAIASATLVCFLAWIAVGMYIDPGAADWLGFALFYSGLFLWICGFLVLIGFYARHFLAPEALPYYLLSIAVRQALIAAIALDIFLILKAAGVFNWISGIFLLIAVIFTEGYFLSLNKR